MPIDNNGKRLNTFPRKAATSSVFVCIVLTKMEQLSICGGMNHFSHTYTYMPINSTKEIPRNSCNVTLQTAHSIVKHGTIIGATH